MRRKTHRAVNRGTVAMLCASMTAPAVAPAVSAFAEEVENNDLVGDLDLIPGAGNKATPTDADKKDNATSSEADDEIKDLDIPSGNTELPNKAPAKDQETKYAKFGTQKFWTWYGEAYQAYLNGDTTEDEFMDLVAAWHDSIASEEKGTESEADKAYPAYGSAEFEDWLFGEAITVKNQDEDRDAAPQYIFNNTVLLDYLRHASAEDAYQLLIDLYGMRGGIMTLASSIGNLWPSGYGAGGDLFQHGRGTAESPYEIDSVEDLRALAVAIAQNQYNDSDTYYYIKKGTYDLNGIWIPIGFAANAGGEYTAFRANIAADSNAHIKNLGFKSGTTASATVSAELAETIRKQNSLGFFGEIGAGATVTNLNIDTDRNTIDGIYDTNTDEGNANTGILAGYAVDATIKECTVSGAVKGTGYVGGLVGLAESSMNGDGVRTMHIEDCHGNHVYAYTVNPILTQGAFEDGHSAVGGIVGKAVHATIMDVDVSTDQAAGQHIYGNGAYTGGIAGVIEDADIFNSYVSSGEIGSSDGYSTGGIVGGYMGGQIKVARFNASVIKPTSGYNYSAVFIGSKMGGVGFTYGKKGDIAYLFTDSKAKADTGIAGGFTVDASNYDDDAHVGYWHDSDIYFTLISGNQTDTQDKYFYKELEDGILNIKDTVDDAEVKTLNHFTANAQGRPTRGYLLTLEDPKVDGTVASKMSAYISGSYKPEVTSENQGAFAAGDVVYIQFEDQSNGEAYFQMDETKTPNPYYNYYDHDDFTVYEEDTTQKAVTKRAGYYITMPDSDTTVGAVYKKVAQAVTNSPNKIVFEVTQRRTGARENPRIEWLVTAYNGNKDYNGNASIISDANGKKWENIPLLTINPNGQMEVPEDETTRFWIKTLVNNEANKQFLLNWTTSNDSNADGVDSNIVSQPTAADGLVYNESAYFSLNVTDSALSRTVKELEDAQKAGGYKDSMTTKAPIYFHSLITSTASVDDSADKQNPPKGKTDIDIKLNIDDRTTTSLTGVHLSNNSVTYDVVRTLTGDRAHPTVTYTVNGSTPDAKKLTTAFQATFNPDYFANDAVKWYLADAGAVTDISDPKFETDRTQSVGDMNSKSDNAFEVTNGTGEQAYRSANVTLKGVTQTGSTNDQINAWVQEQDANYTSQRKKVPADDTYSYHKYVKVTAKDTNNNTLTDTALVTLNFKTVDQTEIMPTKVSIDRKENVHNYKIRYTFKGNNKSDVVSRSITLDDAALTKLTNGVGDDLSATVTPEVPANNDDFTPYENGVVWSLANPDETSGLDPYDVLSIDQATGQITVRGYNADAEGNGYSPWVQSLISENKLSGTTVPIRLIARSVRDNTLVDYKDITVTFTAGTMDNVNDALTYDVVFTKNKATSLSGTDIQAEEKWTGTEAKQVSAAATGTSEAPQFAITDADGNPISGDIVKIANYATDGTNATGDVVVNTDAKWIQDIISGRADGNRGTQTVFVKAFTENGSSVTYTPVTVNFRYDGTDMIAETVKTLPDGYPATPEVTTSATPQDTYDINKAKVVDRQITLDVVAKQGNYSQDNPGTRKWSYGIAKLGNTTYSSQGVRDDAVYELTGDVAKYAKIDANGYLVPIMGNWKDVIDAGKTSGTVSGIVTAKKDIDGKVTSDSYKVTINFRYDKSVLESHEETFNVVYTQDSQTNSVKSHWDGDRYIQLKATIHDASGNNVTPVWESSDESIVTVDQDGRVSVNKDTWIKQIIDDAQTYGNKPHSGTKTVYVTAKHPATGETADTCEITVNFRYDQSILDKHEEVYNIVLTQTSRTNNPKVHWSGNEVRKLNAEVFVEPGLDNNPYWASEDAGIVKVDDAGNIEPVIDADWMKQIVAEGKYSGQKKVAINATNKTATVKDSANVLINFKYEDVKMAENAKEMNVTITATGNRSNPTYTVTGDTASAVSAVLHSAKDGETKVIYSSDNSGLISVDQNGKLNLVLPTVTDKDGKVVQAQGATFSNNAHAFIKEALKHSFVDRDGQRYISSGTVVITGASEDGRMADQCNVKLNIKYLDQTRSYSGGGGGGGGSSSGGGGGGGSSSKGVTPHGSTNQSSFGLPSYVIKGGTWTQDATGAWYYANGRTFTDEWAALQNPYADPGKGQSTFDWFHFGKDSKMTAGWFTDANGDTFYLHTLFDGTQGRMYTGWNWIDDNGDGMAECYYFQEISDGHRGRLYRSATTPDGYTVNDKGQWTQNGTVIQKDLKAEEAARKAAEAAKQASDANKGSTTSGIVNPTRVSR